MVFNATFNNISVIWWWSVLLVSNLSTWTSNVLLISTNLYKIIHHTLSSFMTYHRVCNKSNKTGATRGAGSAYPFDAPEFTPVLSIAQSLVFCVALCRSLFVLLPLFFVHFMVCPSSSYGFYDYPFGVFKLFLHLSSVVRMDQNGSLSIKEKSHKEWYWPQAALDPLMYTYIYITSAYSFSVSIKNVLYVCVLSSR